MTADEVFLFSPKKSKNRFETCSYSVSKSDLIKNDSYLD
ncbi:hypothetical protein HDEF_1401 [Candidatus Hamiltonella defensa 5AT (Acyrthosiphon pisum)]|uniref:Uncharacterized protein n=1 Tax=Hamiltonella defensa subsp. Acyrthosiphon pisum (strain 5AT) TaxID=572265 RepID=C4K640_HAMD5|nr:hypothetical protein HDEF_1401 [Candidatus Hamiltonella defensa 5AT (Acyrthosiphon pisum)]